METRKMPRITCVSVTAGQWHNKIQIILSDIPSLNIRTSQVRRCLSHWHKDLCRKNRDHIMNVNSERTISSFALNLATEQVFSPIQKTLAMKWNFTVVSWIIRLQKDPRLQFAYEVFYMRNFPIHAQYNSGFDLGLGSKQGKPQDNPQFPWEICVI